MILSLLAGAALLQQEETGRMVIKLYNPVTHVQTGMVEQFMEPLRTPEKSPKAFGQPPTHWIFNYETVGFELMKPADPHNARFYVFSQNREPNDDPALSVARMLQRLWEYNYGQLKIDHSDVYGSGVVDVFLCNGGVPGGEQLLDEDEVNAKGRSFKVNTIYLYDLPTFRDPLEMVREVAHEYGHATLTGVRGYKEPEDWANGYFGEKLYLKHIDEAMRAHTLEPADAMGISLEALDKWLADKVNPLVIEAAQRGPDLAALKRRDSKGMDNFMGLALYIDTILPETLLGRSLDLIPINNSSANAEDYPDAVALAAQELHKYNLNIPEYLKGKNLWIPLGEGHLEGAKVVRKTGDWAFISPTGAVVSVTPKPIAN